MPAHYCYSSKTLAHKTVAKNLNIDGNFVFSSDLSEEENQLVRDLIKIHITETSRPGRVTPISQKLGRFYAYLEFLRSL